MSPVVGCPVGRGSSNRRRKPSTSASACCDAIWPAHAALAPLTAPGHSSGSVRRSLCSILWRPHRERARSSLKHSRKTSLPRHPTSLIRQPQLGFFIRPAALRRAYTFGLREGPVIGITQGLVRAGPIIGCHGD
jgi:hypothetical protein